MKKTALILCALLVLGCTEKIVPDPDEIPDFLFLEKCALPPGATFPVSWSGFRQGDVLLLESDGEVFPCETAVSSGKAVLTLPEGISSGTWRLAFERAGESRELGAVDLTIDPAARPLRRPAVIAHRGFHDRCPENSIAALRKAQDAGADGSETDVWMSADGEIFIRHDEYVYGKYIIRETQSSVLSKCKLDNGEKLPTLKSYLEQAVKSPSCRLVIEIKDHKDKDKNALCVEKVVKLVREAGMQDRVDYNSFNWDVCRSVVQAKGDDKATVGFITYGPTDYAGLFSDGILNLNYFFNTVRENPGYLDDLWNAGLMVSVWTLCDKDEILDAIRLKVGVITTDTPATAIEICNRLF